MDIPLVLNMAWKSKEIQIYAENLLGKLRIT